MRIKTSFDRVRTKLKEETWKKKTMNLVFHKSLLLCSHVDIIFTLLIDGSVVGFEYHTWN